jgi:diacylglycerol kinase (ATP)
MRTKQELQKDIRKHRTAVLIVNTKSRKGGLLFREAQRMLAEKGITLTKTYAVKNPEFMDVTIKKILRTNPDLIIVGSGDGTMAEVVDHLANCDVAVGYLPMGTTNNFARTLGIPLELEAAVDVIASARVADIDLGTINGDYFANACSIGISVDISRTVSHRLKRRLGRLAYMIAGARALLSHHSFDAELTTEKGTYKFTTHQIIIVNGRFHGGTLIAEDASVDSHELVIFYLGDHRRWQLLRSMVLFTLKRRRTIHEGHFFVTKKARLVTRPKRRVEMDGEVKATTPVDIAIAPNALKIIVPKDFFDD